MLNTKQQGRLDGFFKVTESASSKAKATAGKGTAGNKGAGAKRKVSYSLGYLHLLVLMHTWL
jgi:hypothetical protein